MKASKNGSHICREGNSFEISNGKSSLTALRGVTYDLGTSIRESRTLDGCESQT